MSVPGRTQRWLLRVAAVVLALLLWRLYAAEALAFRPTCQREPPVLCAVPDPANWTAGCHAPNVTATPEGHWWTCVTAVDCVRGPAFWRHPRVLGGWPDRLSLAVPAPLCDGRLTYLEALRRTWPADLGPGAACAEAGAALAEVLAAVDLNVQWAEAPVRPPALWATVDTARLALDDCCAGEPVNATRLHVLTADLYAYLRGAAGVAVCPDPYLDTDPAPPVPWVQRWHAFLYGPERAGPLRLTVGGRAVVGVLVGACVLFLVVVVLRGRRAWKRVRHA